MGGFGNSEVRSSNDGKSSQLLCHSILVHSKSVSWIFIRINDDNQSIKHFWHHCQALRVWEKRYKHHSHHHDISHHRHHQRHHNHFDCQAGKVWEKLAWESSAVSTLQPGSPIFWNLSSQVPHWPSNIYNVYHILECQINKMVLFPTQLEIFLGGLSYNQRGARKSKSISIVVRLFLVQAVIQRSSGSPLLVVSGEGSKGSQPCKCKLTSSTLTLHQF